VPIVRKGNDGQPELWATDVRWTERGRLAVESKLYRYCVPCFVVNQGDRRATRLVSLALTNTLFDCSLEPLVP
jgi:phage I-like protein